MACRLDPYNRLVTIMKRFAIPLALVILAVAAMASWASSSFGQGPVVITLDPGTRFQTIVGWEAVAGIGIKDFPTLFQGWEEEVNDRVVTELGINRLRVESHRRIHAVEDPNDNSDPLVIDWNGFDFTIFDKTIEHIVLPMRQHVEANGERLYVNFITVDVAGPNDVFHKDPDEFAEFVLAHFLHMQSKYNFVPDGVEVALEPKVFNVFDQNPLTYAAALVATGDRLAANGFTPDFIGPSNTSTGEAIGWFDQIITVPGVLNYLTEFSYHRYSVGSGHIQAIADRAQLNGVGTSMLEHIGSGYQDLHEDLTVGDNVAWQQFTIAYPTGDNGAQYYVVNNPSNPTVGMGTRTKFLRQYFKFIRAGAERIEATTTDGSFDPVAFINTNGKYVVVVKVNNGGNFTIDGLPAGTYGIKYTTDSVYDFDHPDIPITQGQGLSTSIPAGGAITVYQKQAEGTQFHLCISEGLASGTPTPCPSP